MLTEYILHINNNICSIKNIFPLLNFSNDSSTPFCSTIGVKSARRTYSLYLKLTLWIGLHNKYDSNKNITSIPEDKSEQTIQKELPDGTIVTNFENGKTQIIEPDGDDYIINTD